MSDERKLDPKLSVSDKRHNLIQLNPDECTETDDTNPDELRMRMTDETERLSVGWASQRQS